LSVNHRAIDGPEFVQHFHARGYGVWSWTVNDLRRARQLAGWGVDGILGDNPALLRRLL
jgi:glycerophosphoryl diester phosphodiesterase